MAMNSRAQQVAQETLRMDQKFGPPQAPNPERAVRDMTELKTVVSGDNSVAKSAPFPISALHTGKYIEDDDRTTYYKAHEDVVRSTGDRYGQHFAPPGLVDYFLDKKNKELYFHTLKFGEYLADPKRPETQEHLYSIFPELKERPDQLYREELALQMTLRYLLRDGVIKSKTDHMLVAHVCRPDFEIPVFPAWDPTGIFMKGTDFYAKSVTRGMKRGLFNPLKYADGADNADNLSGAENPWTQQQLKLAIVRRLYPGLRDASNNEILNALQRTVLAGAEDGSIQRRPMGDGYDTMWWGSGDKRTPTTAPYTDANRTAVRNPGFTDLVGSPNNSPYQPTNVRGRFADRTELPDTR